VVVVRIKIKILMGKNNGQKKEIPTETELSDNHNLPLEELGNRPSRPDHYFSIN